MQAFVNPLPLWPCFSSYSGRVGVNQSGPTAPPSPKPQPKASNPKLNPDSSIGFSSLRVLGLGARLLNRV